jgi:hypothetical protein
MRCRIELQKLQATVVEITVPDDANRDVVYQAALENVEKWEDVGKPDIEFYEELPSFKESCMELPKVKIGEKIYDQDDRLQQFRHVDNPHDWIPFDDVDWDHVEPLPSL